MNDPDTTTTGFRWDRVEITHISLAAVPPDPNCTLIDLSPRPVVDADDVELIQLCAEGRVDEAGALLNALEAPDAP